MRQFDENTLKNLRQRIQKVKNLAAAYNFNQAQCDILRETLATASNDVRGGQPSQELERVLALAEANLREIGDQWTSASNDLDVFFNDNLLDNVRQDLRQVKLEQDHGTVDSNSDGQRHRLQPLKHDVAIKMVDELPVSEKPVNCLVCGKDEARLHHGSYTCNRCCTFFRRSVLSENSGQCRYNNKCVVGPVPVCCKSCHYARCLETGMDPDWVGTNDLHSKSVSLKCQQFMAAAKAPVNVKAASKITSVVGEQTVDLLPLDHASKLLNGPLTTSDDADVTSSYESTAVMRRAVRTLADVRQKPLHVTLVAGDGQIRSVRRSLLIASSGYFKKLLLNSERDKVSFNANTGLEMLQILATFFETGEVEVSNANVKKILSAASVLEMTELQEVCCSFLQPLICPANCLSIWTLATANKCSNLVKSALTCILTKFDDVLDHKEFLELPETDLFDILLSEDLAVKSIPELDAKMLQWISHDDQNREVHFKSLRKCIKFMKDKSVSTNQSPHTKQLSDNFEAGPSKNAALVPSRGQAKYVKKQAQILAVGGWHGNKALSSVEMLNTWTSEWSMMASMPKPRGGLGLVTYDGLVYAIGGQDAEGLSVGTVDMYDPTMDIWSSLTNPMNTSRYSMSIVVCDCSVYAAGGNNGMVALDTVERYDIARNNWTGFTPMSSVRQAASATMYNGSIYVAGGSDTKGRKLKSVERMDPREGKWATVPEMSVGRSHHGSAILHGCLHIVGGRVELFRSIAHEKFDFRADKWWPAGPLSNRRSEIGLVGIEDELYAVGGCGDEGAQSIFSDLDTVEIYNGHNYAWRSESSLLKPRRGAGVVALETSILEPGPPTDDEVSVIELSSDFSFRE